MCCVTFCGNIDMKGNDGYGGYIMDGLFCTRPYPYFTPQTAFSVFRRLARYLKEKGERRKNHIEYLYKCEKSVSSGEFPSDMLHHYFLLVVL